MIVMNVKDFRERLNRLDSQHDDCVVVVEDGNMATVPVVSLQFAQDKNEFVIDIGTKRFVADL